VDRHRNNLHEWRCLYICYLDDWLGIHRRYRHHNISDVPDSAYRSRSINRLEYDRYDAGHDRTRFGNSEFSGGVYLRRFDLAMVRKQRWKNRHCWNLPLVRV
jgi:hypothetical protein